ncbi:hypothetical protein C8T65DRAFT_669165 [Cerioporus squamosus]|nr:hypothetical protein C8T65DRAFT_669165 [Cerioporus squamosus]
MYRTVSCLIYVLFTTHFPLPSWRASSRTCTSSDHALSLVSSPLVPTVPEPRRQARARRGSHCNTSVLAAAHLYVYSPPTSCFPCSRSPQDCKSPASILVSVCAVRPRLQASHPSGAKSRTSRFCPEPVSTYLVSHPRACVYARRERAHYPRRINAKGKSLARVASHSQARISPRPSAGTLQASGSSATASPPPVSSQLQASPCSSRTARTDAGALVPESRHYSASTRLADGRSHLVAPRTDQLEDSSAASVTLKTGHDELG